VKSIPAGTAESLFLIIFIFVFVFVFVFIQSMAEG